MLKFDGGRFSELLAFFTSVHTSIGRTSMANSQFLSLPLLEQSSIRDRTEQLCVFCEEATLPMTGIVAKRLREILTQPTPTLLLVHLQEITSDIAMRLRDEAGTTLFLRIPMETARFYINPSAGWEETAKRFPNTISDIEEASICFALERYAACVFHCVQIVESGLITLGEFLNVKDPKSGWTATSNELDRITKKKYIDLTAFESQHIEFLKQIQATVVALQDAWRNKISHAQGRLVVLTADFSPRVAEEIIVASRGFMRRLATDLP